MFDKLCPLIPKKKSQDRNQIILTFARRGVLKREMADIDGPTLTVWL